MATVHIITDAELRSLVVEIKREFEQRILPLDTHDPNKHAMDRAYRFFNLQLHAWASRCGFVLPHDC